MTTRRAKIRLHVAADLGPGAQVAFSPDQAHYLTAVMRQGAGDQVLVFNGRDGEWLVEITQAGKRACAGACRDQTRPQTAPPDLWLLFAPVKKARTDFIAEKACEMGCRRLVPVFTRFTNSGRVNTERLAANAVEAAEQCGLLSAPEVAAPQRLDALLDGWDPARRLLFCDETLAGPAQTLAGAKPGPWAVLIGPEGGFAPEEAHRLRNAPFVTPIALGPRILRADTAAVAALTLWQAALGDWR